ncbi:MAG: hypothetical protein IKU18_01635 [Bacteroidales bacterium]|nr:hypothetical protein [Bacteroidales bacterium]
MKKGLLHKISTLAVAVATMFLGYSCQQEEFLYTPDNACVTFQNAPTTNFELNGDALAIQIMRGVTNTEETIDVKLADGSIYTLENSTVKFEKGEGTKTLTLTYDESVLEPYIEYPFELSFNSSLVSPTGKSTFKAAGMVPFSLDDLEYVDYGIVNFESDMFGRGTIFSPTSTLQVAKYTKNYFRIKNVLGSGLDIDFIAYTDGSIEYTNIVETDPGALNKYGYDLWRFDTSIKLPAHAEGGVEIPGAWLNENLTMWFDTDDGSWDIKSYSEEGYPLVEGTYLRNYAIWSTTSGGLITSDYYRPDYGTGDDGWWRIYINVESVF